MMVPVGTDYEVMAWGSGYYSDQVSGVSVIEDQTTIVDFALYHLVAGDVNGDAGVDVADAILVLRYIVGLAELAGEYWEQADVNGDGKVDVSDAILILRYIVGLVTTLPV
jgi:hypothetical protein